MPHRTKGESLTKYVSRCVAERQKEHPNEDQKQSVAICYSMGRSKKWGGKKK